MKRILSLLLLAAALATPVFAANDVDNPAQPSSTTPLGDGTAAVGNSAQYARGNHVHPIDTHMGVLVTSVTSVNFNSANTDTAITVTMPVGYTRFIVFRLNIDHPSAPLSTSTFGLFTTTGGGGTTIAANQANTITTASDATTNNALTVNASSVISMVASALPTANTVYFRVGTAQGSAATGDVSLTYFVLP